MQPDLFLEIARVLVLGTGVSFLVRLFKQPLIVGYIFTGVIAGPMVLNIIHSGETLELFSKMGIVILLFIVGLHLSPKVVSEVGKVSVFTGLGQIIFTSIFGFIIALSMGWQVTEAAYIAIALTFSSTIIILKLLTDKGAVHTLYGRVSIGFLLVQDLVAALILIMVAAFSGSTGQPTWFIISFFLVKILIVSLIYLFSTKWLLPRLLAQAALSTELLFLFSLTWAISYAALFHFIGLSVEIGALIAGISLSSSYVADEIGARLIPLRDFFITLFFIYLGSTMDLAGAESLIVPVVILSIFVLIGNPMIVVILMNYLGYHRKTGFMAGLTVAQISEFSLILAALGHSVGQVSDKTLTMITLVGLITISGSTYMILYAEQIYPRISNLLTYLEFKKTRGKRNKKVPKYDILLFGFQQNGSKLLHLFRKLEHKVAVVDFDPELIDQISSNKVDYFYGDAGSIEFLESLPFDKARLVISSISSSESNKLIIRQSLVSNPNSIIIIFAGNNDDVRSLYDVGATYVISSPDFGARHAVNMISRHGFEKQSYEHRQKQHIRELSFSTKTKD